VADDPPAMYSRKALGAGLCPSALVLGGRAWRAETRTDSGVLRRASSVLVTRSSGYRFWPRYEQLEVMSVEG